MAYYIWLVFGVFMIIIEIFTPGFFAASLGISSVLTSFIALIFPDIIYLHWLAFIVFNIVMFVFLRKIFIKYLYNEKQSKKTNIDAIIGKTGIVQEKIDDKGGYVKVYGDMWKAILAEDGKKIQEGKKVQVVNVEGNKVIVKKIERR